MSAYVIVNVATTDPQRYEDYKKSAQEAVAHYGGKYLIRGGKFQVLEGEWTPTRIAMLEFPTYERALEWWNSPEYGPGKALRQSISTTEMILVEGMP